MYYIVYKTTNLINGKYYIGAHRTDKLDDDYFGSGVALKKAISKHGTSNFKREILKICETIDEMFSYEKEMVDKNDPMTYNMTLGGKGGFDHIDISGDKNPMKNPEVVRKMVNSTRKNGSYHSEERIQHQKRITELSAKKSKGKKRPDHSAFMSNWAADNWSKNRENIRNSLSSTFKVTSPKNVEYITNRLKEFCETHNITYSSLWNTTRTNKPITKGKAKGWKCQIIQT